MDKIEKHDNTEFTIDVQALAAENRSRNEGLQVPYDPLTGEGCCGERRLVSVPECSTAPCACRFRASAVGRQGRAHDFVESAPMGRLHAGADVYGMDSTGASPQLEQHHLWP